MASSYEHENKQSEDDVGTGLGEVHHPWRRLISWRSIIHRKKDSRVLQHLSESNLKCLTIIFHNATCLTFHVLVVVVISSSSSVALMSEDYEWLYLHKKCLYYAPDPLTTTLSFFHRQSSRISITARKSFSLSPDDRSNNKPRLSIRSTWENGKNVLRRSWSRTLLNIIPQFVNNLT